MKQATRTRIERWLRKRGYTTVQVVELHGDTGQPKYILRLTLAVERDGQVMTAVGHGRKPEAIARKVVGRLHTNLRRCARGATLRYPTDMTPETAAACLAEFGRGEEHIVR